MHVAPEPRIALFATGQYNLWETIHEQAIEPAQCHVVAKQQWIFGVRKLIRCGEWLALAFKGHPASSQKASDAQEPMNSFLVRLREVESRFLLMVFQPLMDSLFGFAY